MKKTALLLLAIVVASCAPPVTITTSRRVITEATADCRPSGGGVPAVLDTSCAVEGARCYKIGRMPAALQSGVDDFGMVAAAVPGDAGSEVLVFTSIAPVAGGAPNADGSQNLWYVVRATNGEIRYRAPLTSNTRTVHEGAAAISPDGQFLYFAAKNRPDTLGDCDLYVTRILRQDGRIVLTDPILVDHVNSPHFDSHPSISPDGTALYFASDRPGGYGNTDLWMSTRNSDGSWSEPKNLGPAINSSCNEMTPFICGDNRTLYFASDGHNSVGGLDIFLAERTATGWSAPVNAGIPLNTPDDECFPSTPPTARADSVLYFSSTRSGGSGGYDLYGISPNPQPPTLITLRGRVLGGLAKEPVGNARLFWKDKSTGAMVATVETNRNGEYYVVLPKGRKYDVGAQAERFFYDTYSVDAPATPGVREYAHDFLLTETLNLRINFPFNDAEHPLEFVLDENGNASTTTWREAIEYLGLNLKSYRDRIESITLAGHTDSVGTREYNRVLSQKRAEFVKRMLVTVHDIDGSIITVAAKGMSELLPHRPGESDEAFNARCRRVELTKVTRKDGGKR